MRLRFAKVDEFQFLTCVKHQVWGSQTKRFSKWEEGDFLAIIVNKQIAGLAEINGKPFHSEQVVWDNGLFPYRIPLKFRYIFTQENRPKILGRIRDAMLDEWPSGYGLRILGQHLMNDKNSDIIINEIKSRKNEISRIKDDIENLLCEASQKRNEKGLNLIEPKKKGRQKKTENPESLSVGNKPEIILPKTDEESSLKLEESLHSKAQYLLSKIAHITGCNNFIASNDRKRKYNGIQLGTLTEPTLPNLGFTKDVMDRISLIDVIWLKGNMAVCAFEVETSTSIYSGLLRMSDLLAVIPNLNIKIYIVAQEERKNKVLEQLARPTFLKIGLNDYCEFISIEKLEELFDRIEDLMGHVNISVLDRIAIGLEENG